MRIEKKTDAALIVETAHRGLSSSCSAQARELYLQGRPTSYITYRPIPLSCPEARARTTKDRKGI